ncbi:MAG: hypothetical protein KKA67_08285 [Spirochaetes bacterium]|nr:hypothetical protein [Spirochaetota bacterium]MBU1079431.1 hypothetical protein [Spirochaetota bacterium]
MGNRTRIVAGFIAVAAVSSLSSCFSLPGLGGFNPLADLQSSVSARASAEVSSAVGITGMSRKMMFNVLYSQIFYIGGFGAGFYDLEETQGAVWRIESYDEDGKMSAVEAERAFLKAMPNGDRWWYLSWRADGESWEFEALMDKNLMARKIRYFNEDVKRVEEAKFEEPGKAKPDSETAPPEAAPASGLDPKDLPKYVDGKETIKVKAGTFQTERIEWSFYDEDEKATYRYIWWVDPKASGGLVRFQWTSDKSKESIQGELVSLKKGYKSKFASF